MNIYLASSLHTDELKSKINTVVEFLRSKGQNVFSPLEMKIPDAWNLSNAEWAKQVYDNDVKALNNSDIVVCIYNGFSFNGGTGTAWEVGYAKALNKDVIVLCTNPDDAQSLMIINSGTIVVPYCMYKEAWVLYSETYVKERFVHSKIKDQK